MIHILDVLDIVKAEIQVCKTSEAFKTIDVGDKIVVKVKILQ